MNKSATHNGVTCIFDGKKHLYTVQGTGRRLESVTTIIKRYTPPFDAPVVAQKMVDDKNPKYKGMTAPEILKQWSDKAKLSSQEGTSLHEYLEQWPTTKGFGFMPPTYRVLMMTKQVDRLFPKLLDRFRLIAAEQIVFSARLGLAGQVDLILADDATQQGILIDWKSNAKMTDETSAFGNMLAPIDHLKDCDTVKYGLQLAIYEKILKSEGYFPEFSGYRKSLIHIGGAFGRVVKVDDYKEEIECLK